MFICINNTISMAFNPRVSVLRRNPFWWKSWYLSENGSDWMLNYWSLHYFPTCCDDIIFLCLICFVQEFFWFCVFFFFVFSLFFRFGFIFGLFSCQTKIFGLFMVEPKISGQLGRVNSVESTQSKTFGSKGLYPIWFAILFC